MGPFANLIVLAGIGGFKGPDPMAPYLALGWPKSAVLFSSSFRFLRPDHGDLCCWLEGAGTESVATEMLAYTFA